MKWGICYGGGNGAEHIRRGVEHNFGAEKRGGSGGYGGGSGNHSHVSCPLQIFPPPLQIRLLDFMSTPQLYRPTPFLLAIDWISHYS